ncbi:DNA ligase 1 [Olea europaea var. sylvestris]|uniref:DNA ligase 1 n=1 Tax=Olea europaea var. sylvestris TaxID=158386 RepID=UPI000C1CE5AD|nr:DNA ligase 1 [Olea europaea var. sylvestris]
MSATRASAKKRVSESNNSKSESRKRVSVDDDFDADISNDIKGIMSALKQIKEKAQKDGQKKNEETISSVASDIKSILDGLKSKLEKERQNFAKALSKSSKECENLLKNETAKFQAVYDGFCKEKATHLQALKDVFDKYEEEKERLISRYEQLRKKEKSILSENEKASAARISELDESLKKKKQDDKTFSILKKTLGSFLGDVSDEDFLPDD